MRRSPTFRPNEAEVVVKQVVNGRQEGVSALHGVRADSISVLAGVLARQEGVAAAWESVFDLEPLLRAHLADLSAEVAKEPRFQDPNMLAQVCFEIAASCLLFVETVAWNPDFKTIRESGAPAVANGARCIACGADFGPDNRVEGTGSHRGEFGPLCGDCF